jgi:hypothetical protein
MNLKVLGASLAVLTMAGGLSVTQIQAKTTQSTPGVKELTIKNQSDCSPAYPDVCIRPPVPYSLNCKDITERDFRVLQSNDPMPINPYGYDPHGFDRNKNRVGCETITSGGRTRLEDE